MTIKFQEFFFPFYYLRCETTCMSYGSKRLERPALAFGFSESTRQLPSLGEVSYYWIPSSFLTRLQETPIKDFFAYSSFFLVYHCGWIVADIFVGCKPCGLHIMECENVF